MKKILGAFGAILLALGTQTVAAPAPDLKQMDVEALQQQIDAWLNKEIVAMSVKAHNEKYGNMSDQDIITLDNQWRAEAEADDKPLIAATLSSPLSVYLSRMQGQSVGLFVEIFVMDNKGLNVGQSSITSDFWQGDEAKFQKTYDVGPKAVFVDDPEWDDNFNIWRAQINKSLTDPATGQLIGAATIEVNLTEWSRRQLAAN
ncbi:hypothetical protein SAMN04488056_103225 [Cohaesibacter marisflavi]|uniref:Uncharacterized protein n=1 Tax=Cohaesibacter marisflavi TaxID=655353 RepID=A0A1I5EKB2_9HYPH|nr:hypothetical protein [Cohaesibacter marisflavi]SFO11944.1 hypothetical protein SAMN04488056_103225 [Cohaesibacter marisflavi]